MRALLLALLVAPAIAAPQTNVTITADGPVQIQRRTDNAGKAAVLTVNKQDKVTIQAPAPATAASAAAPAPAPAATTAAVDPAKPAMVPVPPPPNLPPTPADHHAGVPAGLASVPPLQPGINTVLLSTPTPLAPLPAAGNWEQDGKFRVVCNVAWVSYDDPIVYPGQPGAAHLHVGAGTTALDAFTTTANIRSKGNSSCRGGTINLSAYWAPAMVNTANKKVVLPRQFLNYYATGLWAYMNDGSQMQPVPRNLVMIAGDAKRTTPGNPGHFSCLMKGPGFSRAGFDRLPSIPVCVTGEDEMWMVVTFPQCWDGKNLDSPDHRSHMAYPETNTSSSFTPSRQYRCPATHPVVIPEISYRLMYEVPANAVDMKAWRLSSDVYEGPAGYSLHADLMYGWDPAIADAWGAACIRARRNCGTAQLADGRTTLEFQGN